MSNPRRTHVTPLWWSAPGCLVQGFGVFLLPFLVALPAVLLFESSEVLETGPVFLTIAAFLLGPTFFIHILGLSIKSYKDLKYHSAEGTLTLARFSDILYRHVSIITLRGWALLFSGLFLTFVAIPLKWASLGTLAVSTLLIFYMVVGWTLFVSTFLVRSFDVGMGRDQSGIERQMLPAVASAGHAVTEVVRIKQVPVPIGYVLLIEDPNPARLKTESRYSVGANARTGEVEIAGTLRATPRGMYQLGPARILYQDILGITRISVSSAATATLKVLPPLQPVVVEEAPKSKVQAPDVLTRPNRYATEDYFRFREYQPGDDTRRIHWRLSMRTGKLQVRLPETKEITSDRILLILDTFLPQGRLLNAAEGAGEILDALVLAFIGIGKELVNQGNQVTAVSAVVDPLGKELMIESLDGRRAQARQWQDLGARANWQGKWDIPDLLAKSGDETHGIIVTARFTAPPPTLREGQATTWLFMDPSEALGPPDPHWIYSGLESNTPLEKLKWIFRLPHPVGSTENSSFRRAAQLFAARELYWARRVLRYAAKKRAGITRTELLKRGDPVYRIERKANHIRLVGQDSLK